MKAFLEELAATRVWGMEKVAGKANEALALGKEKDSQGIERVVLHDNDPFGQKINTFTDGLPPQLQMVYYPLLAHCKKASGGKPGQKYAKETQQLIEAIGSAAFLATAKEWLYFLKVLELSELVYTRYYDQTTYTAWGYLQEANVIAVKGLIWALRPVADPETINLLAAYAEKCYGKIGRQGQLAAGLGNACLYVLAGAGLAGVSHLSRLKRKIRQGTTQNFIEQYIAETSKALGASPAEVEDMAVPDFGLTAGEAVYAFEGYRATLRVTGIGKTAVQWAKADGTPLKGEPVAFKKSHGAALKEIKNTAAQVQKTLTAQRDRLDRAFIADRRWSYDQFTAYYLHHGLMGYLTKQLIWTFTQNDRRADAFWLDGTWRDAQGNAVDWVGEGTQVQVWHPIGKPLEEVLAWREFLTSRQVRQPLKQAYREVYLLTDAEVNTRTYSNRMAAHVLRQHQFNALAKLRGWKYSLLGCYDDGRSNQAAEMRLPEHNLQAEFWVNEVNADHAYNDTGIWHYVSTDQVRFCRPDGRTPLPLTEIPPLVLSEVMRDVDLFVGVASVGNDPQWRDNGGLPAYRDYWQSYSFGELSEVAKTRKAVLERLVPRLKIGKRCRVQDKFLVVQGTLRTYKIHLGSGNILMEPNDQYLCIVPDRRPTGAAENVFLPFEGDAVLSIILSKAFLLAADDQITDPTITRQLR